MLRHKKQPTPQELYRERKRREEEERDANLPPGLINHGNTCFMNSTLQGLIATPLLHSLVNFEAVPESAIDIAPYKSPALTNGHGLAGPYEQKWVQGMPLGDVFLATMRKAWDIQADHRRESMSPKDLLTTIGRKYDQYLDFRQQDAHEFLRHMLDAMRMEELDIVKKRQPPPPKRRRTRTATRDPQSSTSQQNATESTTSQGSSEPKLGSFVDMLFGGQLASILVCDTCKKVSVTYEDFNDLSLSIKPEDYVKSRKRDRFKQIAKKLRLKPKDDETKSSGHRSSSVPASPARRSMDPPPHEEEPPLNIDHRRRSFDHIVDPSTQDDNRETAASAKSPADNDETKAMPPQPLPAAQDADVELGRMSRTPTHITFSDTVMGKDKSESESKDKDAWAKLSRRISVSMGMSKKDKRQSRSRERNWKSWNSKDSDASRAPSEERPPPISAARLSATHVENSSDVTDLSDIPRSRAFTPSPITSPSSTPPPNIYNSLPNLTRHSGLPMAEKHSKPTRPPKPSREETAYLRRLLADVHAGPGTFTMLQQALSGGSQNGSVPSSPVMTAQALLAKLGHMPGIEECLRLFTAVEILDGENMVGCHRCWKIANGTYKPRRIDDEKDDSEDSAESPVLVSDADVLAAQMSQRPTRESSPDTQGRVSPVSTTFISGSAASSSLFLHETASISSAPTTFQSVPPEIRPLPISTVLPIPSPPKTPDPPVESYVGLPIPSISTTIEPDSPGSAPPTARPPSIPIPALNGANMSSSSLVPPRIKKRRPSRQGRGNDDSDISSDDGYDSSSSSDDESGISDASSVASTAPSPSGSRSTSPDAPHRNRPNSAQHINERKVPKSQQVIMRRTFKRYLVAVPPPILVVHLKRFQQISKSNPYAMAFSSGFKKLDDFVAFPEYMDLAPFLTPRKEEFGLGRKRAMPRRKDERCVYRLYAVVVHIGNMLGGHYVAYTALPPSRPNAETRHSEEKTSDTPQANLGSPPPPSSEKQPRRWAYVSDTVVRLTTLEEVLKAKAYICMYERI
ncbi:hypothetical protein PHLGIDRAFT_130077 [Phlebiopsis gigantea 11061_1 CR5-6]|uniref:USP domain-containing protein n=1 Tax=Phlebiopsis gigantea (strain 11061_1 CR5-6) TaxID=745531 RepID=A0A0C3S5I6_PHLG1|nr:hypothetical protein PHLGIDRAFT_130077 [Phlebiopsis gigantea 11061_1 CR5-6]